SLSIRRQNTNEDQSRERQSPHPAHPRRRRLWPVQSMSDDDSSALIGYTGFVGSNLLRQRSFDACFNSANIDQIAGRSFDLVVCCGARAEKWKANAEPATDLDNIEYLTRAVERANIGTLVLISTVDVFVNPAGV